ncbi:uncharacterized protein LOC116350734 [Contarinia nasturtii]|uniref:uncharacterized protein LOC116350734 n=1 Tax=Contarinia nasturtii TaxID=265458 RepID=UPI0012D460C6|nr:uncharacterized protein LOC116350734 [Contarinia nasturtii]
MSSSSDFYWKTVNEMLRKDQIDFNQPISTSSEKLPVLRLTFKDSECLNERVQFALKNFKEIARLEYELNKAQPEKITLKHLKWAQIFIESAKEALKKENILPILNAQSDVSVGEFLLECHLLAQQNSTGGFSIQTDAKRKELVSYLLGKNFTEELSTLTPTPSTFAESSQIIFDSADVTSAIDALISNLSDRTRSPWRIGSVYVQESLRNKMLDLLTEERLNAATNGTNERKQPNGEDLAKKFGGKLICNKNGTICLLIDVPPKYIQFTDTPFNQIPIPVNFFRTTKEAIQLVKSTAASIWTENIEIFYEVATELNATIVWSNALGMFDKIMPSLNIRLDSKQSMKSASSVINAKEKYVVHVLDATNNTQKYLYISYGKTFAN